MGNGTVVSIEYDKVDVVKESDKIMVRKIPNRNLAKSLAKKQDS